MSAQNIDVNTSHFRIIEVVLQLKRRGQFHDAKYILACAELIVFAMRNASEHEKQELLLGTPHFQSSEELWDIVCSIVSRVLSRQMYERAVHEVSNSTLHVLAEEAVKSSHRNTSIMKIQK